MTRIIEFVIAFIFVAILFVIGGVMLPAKRSFSYSVETNRPLTTVFDVVNGFHRANDWFPIKSHDPSATLNISGPEMQVGAKLDYSSTIGSLGRGSWELTESVPGEKILYKVENPTMGTDKTSRFSFARTGRGNRNIEITQTYTVDYGWNLIGRYAGLYLARNIGDDIKSGMRNLANQFATIPRFDYSTYPKEIKVLEVSAENVLVAPAAAPRKNDDIALAMNNQMQWIEKVITDSNLEKAGPMRIVTTEFTSDTYTFDVMQPVRKKGSGPKKDDDADNKDDTKSDDPAEGEAAMTPADIQVPEPAGPVVQLDALEKLEVKVTGDGNPVTYQQIPARKTIYTSYVGPSPGLARTRDVLRAWAMTRGLTTTDRAFEDYLASIKSMLDEDAQFRVYWPLEVKAQ